ncbi:hypothetical protein [Pseudomonas sp. GM48]|uniref:hypothetical protein n=1 Tax=Pseudomonas sp. GM48 TaxID=1144330 RepID=UPI0012FC47D7|nr:hypothetical protein [Pseudomonas sp. GM48]
MGNADQLGEPRRYAFFVAAAEGGVRLRSSRKSALHDLSVVPRTLILRLLRSRTQATPAATDCVVAMALCRSVRRTRRYAFFVAAAEGGVRLRSSRKSALHDLSVVPRTLILRLLLSTSPFQYP